jgi:hypothetical protein
MRSIYYALVACSHHYFHACNTVATTCSPDATEKVPESATLQPQTFTAGRFGHFIKSMFFLSDEFCFIASFMAAVR